MYDFVSDIQQIIDFVQEYEDPITHPYSSELEDYRDTFQQFQDSYDETFNDLVPDFEMYSLICFARDNKNLYSLYLSNVTYLQCKDSTLGQVSSKFATLVISQDCGSVTDDMLESFVDNTQTYYDGIKSLLQAFVDRMSATINDIQATFNQFSKKTMVFNKIKSVGQVIDPASIQGINDIASAPTQTGQIVKSIAIDKVYSTVSDIRNEAEQVFTDTLDQLCENSKQDLQILITTIGDVKTNLSNYTPCGGLDLLDEAQNLIQQVISKLDQFVNQLPKEVS